MLSGNRNFEGRINQDVKANYLASPPLVVAYALAGRMDLDLTNEPLGEGSDGEPVYLRDIWPDAEPRSRRWSARSVASEMFTRNYADVFAGDETWNAVEVPEGDRYTWPDSTYVRQPSLLRGDARRAARGRADRAAPGSSPCSATRSPPTTSRPPGAIKKDSPAGQLADRAGRRAAATSTPTARAAATTR